MDGPDAIDHGRPRESAGQGSVLEEPGLVGLHQAAGHGDLATRDPDGVELGKLGLPLRAAVTGVAAGHPPLRHCHEPAPLQSPGIVRSIDN